MPAHPLPSPAPTYGPYRPAPETPAVRRAPQLPMRRREVLAIAAIVALTDIALLDVDGVASGGFGFALWLAGVSLALLLGARVWRASWRLAAFGAALAIVATRTFIDPTPLTTTLGLALPAAFAIALRSPRASVPRVVRSAFRTFVALPNRVRASWLGARLLAPMLRPRSGTITAVVVPLGLCAAFAGIFALANPVASELLGSMWQALPAMSSFPGILRVLVLCLVFLFAAALMRPSISLATSPDRDVSDQVASSTRLAVARNSLVGVNLLFLAYNLLEARYAFGGRPPEGMTAQVYAHEGAFWLTFALAFLTLVTGTLFSGPLAHDTRAVWIRRMAFVWVAQGLVVSVGTYARLGIHVHHSGLSDFRIVGIIGTTLVVLAALLVAYKLHARRTAGWLVRRQLDALAVALVLYAVAPTHYVAARVNVARIEAGETRPLILMRGQARETESASALLPLLDHPDPTVRAGIAGLLERKRQRLHADLGARRSLREDDLVAERVLATLDANEARIESALDSRNQDQAIHRLEQAGYDAMEEVFLPGL